MKIALFILAILALLWLLKGARRRVPPPEKGQPSQPAATQAMLACAHCGMHLPRDEALPGRGGVFCGEAHRHAHEQAHPEA